MTKPVSARATPLGDAESHARDFNLHARAEAMMALLVENEESDRMVNQITDWSDWCDRRDALIEEINGGQKMSATLQPAQPAVQSTPTRVSRGHTQGYTPGQLQTGSLLVFFTRHDESGDIFLEDIFTCYPGCEFRHSLTEFSEQERRLLRAACEEHKP